MAPLNVTDLGRRKRECTCQQQTLESTEIIELFPSHPYAVSYVIWGDICDHQHRNEGDIVHKRTLDDILVLAM